MEKQPSQHETSNSQEEKSAKQTILSVNERLESALDKINRSEENFSNLQSVEDINDHMVVISEALSVANEKLDKLTSKEEPNQESIRETKELVNNLEERKRKLTTEIEQKREKERVVKKFLNSAENLGSKIYQLHMMLTEREDAGINPLITTEPLNEIAQSLLTATDDQKTTDKIKDITKAVGRGAHNIEVLRKKSGPVREDRESLENILAVVRSTAEEIDTLRKQTRSEAFEEDLQKSVQRALEEVEHAVDELGERVHKKLNSLGGY